MFSYYYYYYIIQRQIRVEKYRGKIYDFKQRDNFDNLQVRFALPTIFKCYRLYFYMNCVLTAVIRSLVSSSIFSQHYRNTNQTYLKHLWLTNYCSQKSGLGNLTLHKIISSSSWSPWTLISKSFNNWNVADL